MSDSNPQAGDTSPTKKLLDPKRLRLVRDTKPYYTIHDRSLGDIYEFLMFWRNPNNDLGVVYAHGNSPQTLLSYLTGFCRGVLSMYAAFDNRGEKEVFLTLEDYLKESGEEWISVEVLNG